MATATTTNDRLACNYIRRLVRDNVTSAGMDRDVLDFIEAEKLVKAVRWPGYHITLTEAGREFLAQHEINDDDYAAD